MTQKLLYCCLPQLFEEGFLDSVERVYLDRNCHGLIEWCTLHPNRKEFEGLCWIRPKLSFYDQVFISQDHRFVTNLKSIRKLLPEEKVSLYLFKGLHSDKDFKEAQNIFEEAHWVEFEEGEIAV